MCAHLMEGQRDDTKVTLERNQILHMCAHLMEAQA